MNGRKPAAYGASNSFQIQCGRSVFLQPKDAAMRNELQIRVYKYLSPTTFTYS
jgi:hypothetical protein